MAFCAQKPISAVLLACPAEVNVPVAYKEGQFEWLFGVGRRDDRVMNLGKRRLLGIPIAFNHSATSETSLSLASTTAFTRSAAVLVENEKWLILILSATQIQPRQAQRRSVGCRKMDLRCPSLVVLKY